MSWDEKKYRIITRTNSHYGNVYIVQEKCFFWWKSVQLISSYDGGPMGGASFVHHIDAKHFLLEYIRTGRRML